MAYEVEGKLHKIFPTENKTASFAVREFVIEVPDGQYPQMIKFQAVQDRCNILDNYREGERVRVSFDLRGREWQGKYFTTLNCWRIDRAEGGDAPAGGGNSGGGADMSFPADPFPNYAEAPQAPKSGGQEADFGDLPF